jgi:integral membrane protein
MPQLVTAYRILAYVTGVILVALVFVAVPLNHFAGNPTPSAVIGPLHGFLYMVYVVTTLLLGYGRRWSVGRMVLVLLAGTIPFAAFVAERRVVREARREAAPADPGEPERAVAGE